MRVVAISDTHGKHRQLDLPKGDLLIHAGDVSMKGAAGEIVDFLDWFASQDFQYKVFIAGNHDFFFERESVEQIQTIIPESVTYLNDSQIIINGLKIWGSPITPWFFNWAFNRHRGEAIKRHWDMIPPDTDILITHGPVFRTLDKTADGQHVGCKDLYAKIQEQRPVVHICGHIHEAYGTIEKQGTRFINASILNEAYTIVNNPVVIDL